MTTLRRRGITAATAAAALALGVIPAAFTTSAILADGEGTTTLESGTLPPAPILFLETGAANRVYLDSNRNRTLNQGEPTQALAGNSKSCLLESNESLLAFTGDYAGRRSGDAASFYQGSIGVAEKKSGTSCYEVDASSGDVLTLSLLGTQLEGQYLLDSAALDLDLKQSAVISATAYRDLDGDGALESTEVVGTYQLKSGSSYDPLTTPAPEEYRCPASADSGPDSGASDNCRWEIGTTGDDVTFDALVLKATAGSFSIEGGADGLPTAASEFQLAYGELCVGESRTLPASGSDPLVTVTRIGDAGTEPDECFIYSFEHADQGAELLKVGGSDSAQFIFDFVWTVQANTLPDKDSPTDSVETGLVNRTTVDFDGESLTDTPSVLASCPDLTTQTIDGTTYPVVGGMPGNLNAPDLAPNYPDTDPDDTKQFACIVNQRIDPVAGTNEVRVTERIYAYGDIVLRKP